MCSLINTHNVYEGIKGIFQCINKRNVNHDKIKDAIDEITEISSIINEDSTLILNSININERYKFSFYDYLIISAAINANCQILLSEDMQDGQVIEGKLKIVNSFR